LIVPDPAASVVVVVTDGRANVADGSRSRKTRAAGPMDWPSATRVVVVAAGEDGRAVTDALVEASGGSAPRSPSTSPREARGPVNPPVAKVRDQ